ncbi:VvgS protein [Vibrio sp.]|uniref:VvgS protein n=1 Tax=Vibrio sp. TaxID=678 RepID=UPI003D11497F
MHKIGTLLMALTLGACSTLNADDNFADAVDSVKDRRNYVEVNGKTLTPEFESIKGADILRSTLVLNASASKLANAQDSVNVTMEVSYFQNYDEYTKVEVAGKPQPLKSLQAAINSCNEHCVTTQYLSFPIDTALLESGASQGVNFTLSGAGKRMITQFQIPAGYIAAVLDEVQRYQQPNTTVVSPKVVAQAASTSKAQEMVQYWFGESASAEQEQFSNWAFNNRSGTANTILDSGRNIEMLTYWYNKADEAERKQILVWLLK